LIFLPCITILFLILPAGGFSSGVQGYKTIIFDGQVNPKNTSSSPRLRCIIHSSTFMGTKCLDDSTLLGIGGGKSGDKQKQQLLRKLFHYP